MTLGYWLLLLVLIMIPVALGVTLYLGYKRRKDLEQFAMSAGLAFEPDADRLPPLENSGLELFTQGHSRKFKNLIIAFGAGTERIYFFDYSYVTGSGKNARTHLFTPACFEFREAFFPKFELRPETFLDKLGEMIGFTDIDVDGSPDFSKRYRLTGQDKEAVLAFFGPQTVSFFEQHPGWRAQASGGRIVIFGREGLIPVNVYRDYMEECKDLVSAIARK
jgi:hypothetical protein